MSVLLRRENLTYREQVVYTAGHAFINCTFDGCTVVVREATGVLECCTFVGCVWHLDLFVSDRAHWRSCKTSSAPSCSAPCPPRQTRRPSKSTDQGVTR